jgi:tRNA-dihydrouridine synthase
MDGYSDWPFRSICRALGSAMSYTEFVKVEKILSRSKEPAKRLYYEEAERPIMFQIYGDDPATVLAHLSHILDKLHLANRTQMALYAIREGIAKLANQ